MNAATAAYVPRVAARARGLAIRGATQNVLQWGREGARKLVLLHGWMDVAASFQFVVDALERDWHVIAPDLSGFGRSAWQPRGYWFADYLADLDALLREVADDAPVALAGHSLGANVALHYAGVRPARVERLVALDGFGVRAEASDRAPDKIAAWLDAQASEPAFAPYASFEAVAQRLMRNDPRLTPDKAAFLAQHWAARSAQGDVRLTSDPRHKLPFPTVYRVEEAFAVWRRISAPTLFVAALDSHVPRFLEPDTPLGADPLDVVRSRMREIRDARLVTIADAGHMLHHDQPQATARAIESFLK